MGSHFPPTFPKTPLPYVQNLACFKPTVMYSLSFFQAAAVTLAPSTGELQAILPTSQSYTASEFLSSWPTVSNLLPLGENSTKTTALLWNFESLALSCLLSASQTCTSTILSVGLAWLS